MSEDNTATAIDPSAEAAPVETPDLMSPDPEAATVYSDVPLNEVYLPDEIREDPSVKITKTVTELAKRMIEGQKLIGADKVVIPGKDATDEQWTDVYKKLGRPDTPEAYNIKQSSELPEGTIAREEIEGFEHLVHGLGLSARQTSGIYQFYENLIIDRISGNKDFEKQYAAQATEIMQKEFGNAFGEKIRLANSVFRNTAGGDDALAALKEAGLRNDPRILRWLANSIGPSIGEDRLMGLDGARGAPSKDTPESARAKLAQLRSHPAYDDKYHAEHDTIVKQKEQLLKDAFPD